MDHPTMKRGNDTNNDIFRLPLKATAADLHFRHSTDRRRIMNQIADISRRRVVASGSVFSALAALGLVPTAAHASRNENAFNAKTVAEAIAALGGAPATSKEIVITSPDIAENGAVVPISVQSNLPKTQEIYLLVEKNPNPFAAAFSIPDGTEAYVQTRVKMGQSSNVHAIVKADGKLYSIVKETKVTLGGCGG
jgi:sulfur-oxidizing protein SoxY